MIPPAIHLVFLFILGCFFGSFINVLIDRLPRGEDVLISRSKCDYCKKILKPFDLIPLLSFLLLWGKCRYCRHRLSRQYPLIEALTGFIFASLYFYTILSGSGNIGYFIFLILVFCQFLVIYITDLKERIIPDEINLTLLLTVAIYRLFLTPEPFLPYLVSGFLFSLFFLILVFMTKGKGMGIGDVKFAFIMGLFLGYPKILIAFYLAFLTGAAVSLILVIAGKKRMKSTIAFGPFLIAATVVSYIWGQELYIRLIHFINLS